MHTSSLLRHVVLALTIVAALVPAGCLRRYEPGEDEEEGPRLVLPAPDPVMFEATVYPILLADCGFGACHGDPRRFFTIYGPGRTRLSPETDIFDPPTPEELALSYTRAASMIDPRAPGSSLLVRKPLAVDLGGAGHRGDDGWGVAPYTRLDDPSIVAIYGWALTTPPPPGDP